MHSFEFGRIITRRVQLLAIVTLVVLAGCGKDEPRSEPGRIDSVTAGEEFLLPAMEDGRRLDTVIAVDGAAPHGARLVLSLGADTLRPANARADLLQLFVYDPAAHGYRVAVADTLRWITAVSRRDLTGDGLAEIVVMSDAGGTDAVATRGVTIYAPTQNGLRTLYSARNGDPSFAVDAVHGDQLVMVRNEIWPDFASHADAVEYISDVLAYRNGVFTSVRREHAGIFIDQANAALAEYGRLRPQFAADTLKPKPDSSATPDSLTVTDSLSDTVHPLFMKGALAMLSFGCAGQARSVRAFWASESDYLETRLPRVQFAELRAIYERLAL